MSEHLIEHRPGCPAARLEHPHTARPDIVRCQDCGGQWPPQPERVGPLAALGVEQAEVMRSVSTGGTR